MNLPSYIEDREIITRLNGHGIEVMREVNRRYYAGSKCCDGTRFMRYKFPPNIKSLPYAMKFETVEGMQSFRVIHSDQQRVCWKCYSIDHIITNCPDVRCRVCKLFGHVSYNCKGIPCSNCDKYGDACVCGSIVQTNNKLGEQISDTPNSDVPEANNHQPMSDTSLLSKPDLNNNSGISNTHEVFVHQADVGEMSNEINTIQGGGITGFVKPSDLNTDILIPNVTKAVENANLESSMCDYEDIDDDENTQSQVHTRRSRRKAAFKICNNDKKMVTFKGKKIKAVKNVLKDFGLDVITGMAKNVHGSNK
ncbi:hypothetical protein SNE40_018121 [Patella caerulea]|uniref:CCHC-type domain-containing protein n=1 Tax=Patella caerulea TaxID=87958 RepID=A0AAN8JBY8_PATCE